MGKTSPIFSKLSLERSYTDDLSSTYDEREKDVLQATVSWPFQFGGKNKSNINKTHVYGNYTKHTFNKLKPQMRGKILNNKLEIMNLIKKQLPNNSFLMIKGSNSTGLNKIIKNL